MKAVALAAVIAFACAQSPSPAPLNSATPSPTPQISPSPTIAPAMPPGKLGTWPVPEPFRRLFKGDFTYVVSGKMGNFATHELIMATVVPSGATEAQMESAVALVRRQLAYFPQIKLNAAPTTVCSGMRALDSSTSAGAKGPVMEEWSFVSGGRTYAIIDYRPAGVARSDAVVARIRTFCPGDEQDLFTLHFPTEFIAVDQPRTYRLKGLWEVETLGGVSQQLISMSGTNLARDWGFSPTALARDGWTKRSARFESHCGVNFFHASYTQPGKDGNSMEQVIGGAGFVQEAVIYIRENDVAEPVAVRHLLSGFCSDAPPPLNLAGKWGGSGIQMVVSRAGTTVKFNDCAWGGVANRDASFDSEDNRSFDQSGVFIAADGNERDVRYRGDVQGNAMRLQIVETGSHRNLGTFRLQRGVAAHLTGPHRC